MDKNMRQKKNLQKASSIGLLIMLISIAFAASCTATPLAQTTLEITTMKGGFGKVSVTVKNIGNETAENITMTISVKGGIFGRINIKKICSGCGNCSNSIEPNATKTESTAEAGRIMGFGPVIIAASAQATNAGKVEKTYNGFVLGPMVIVTQ
ncbi:MAG TPA: hypothetical protein VMY59_03525 [Candidatus Thermoplasmatota archaeon]|nr:hypothetical protein [Candidatus Thermoplasmatota archaeon]